MLNHGEHIKNMREFKAQRIRDPLNNLVEFRAEKFENIMWDVIQTRPFQRLRRIKQLGFSDFVYPGATHSRFAHSVGVFHIARRLMGIIEEHLGEKKFDEPKAKAALAAALVHDLGHGPFSHAFENIGKRLDLKMARHETVSDILIRDGEVADALNKYHGGFANEVADIIKAEGPEDIYGAVVSSQFDADRLDYMQRDRLMTGTQHGAIDFEWLISNLEIGKVAYGVDTEKAGELETFVLGKKAIYAAEAYVLGLFQLYPTVYFHKAARGAEKIFEELLYRVIFLIKNKGLKNTGLPSRHPLVQFAKHPENTEHVLSLDDTVIWGALTQMTEAKDDIVSRLAQRLRDRKLFKAINIREKVAKELGVDIGLASTADDDEAEKEIGKKIDRICFHIESSVEDWISKQNEDECPRMLTDKAVREPYKKSQESKGPLNQIRIRTENGDFVDLGERSRVVSAIKPFSLYRIYVPDDDDDARESVIRFIEEGVEHDRNSEK